MLEFFGFLPQKYAGVPAGGANVRSIKHIIIIFIIIYIIVIIINNI